jgi:tetratricopeptide (TPR) repeat protein
MEKDILKLLRKTATKDLVILCGSGISYDTPTSLPTVRSFYEACIKNARLDEALQKKIIGQLKTSQVEPRFEVVLNDIRIYLDNNLSILRVYDDPLYNPDHYFLSHLLSKGGTVITTNFDHCIENASTSGDFNKIVFNGQQNVAYQNKHEGTLIKPHGCILEKDRTKLIATITALTNTTAGYRYYRQWRKLMLGFLKDKTIIVLGYSGSDDFDIMPILESSKHTICIWVNYDAKIKSPENLLNDRELNQKTHRINNCLLYAGMYKPIYEAVIGDRLPISGLPHTLPKTSFLNLLDEVFNSEERRLALTNFILFHHKLYQEIITVNNPYLIKQGSKLLLMQNIMALYRLGDYKAIIKQAIESSYDYGFTVVDLMIQHHLSPCYYYLGDEEKALEILDLFKQNCAKANDTDFLLEALFLEGSIYSNKNIVEKALTAFTNAGAILKKFRNFEMEGKLYWALGDLNQRQQKLTIALNYFERANKLYVKVRNLTSLLFINLNRSGVLLDLDHSRKANSVLKQAEEGLNEYAVNAPGGSHISVYIYFLRAQYHLRKNHMAECCSEVDKLLQTVKHCPGHPYLSFIVLFAQLINKESCLALGLFRRIRKNRKELLLYLQDKKVSIPSEIEPIFDKSFGDPINEQLENEINTFFQKRYYY